MSNKGSQPPETASECVHLPVFMGSLAHPAWQESFDLLSDSGLNAGIGLLTPRHEKVHTVGLILAGASAQAASNSSLSFSTVPWRQSRIYFSSFCFPNRSPTFPTTVGSNHSKLLSHNIQQIKEVIGFSLFSDTHLPNVLWAYGLPRWLCCCC